nr:hypothetical protein Itr_chr11CG19030 [Ipomoea trifida]
MFHRRDSTIQEGLLHCNVSGKEEGEINMYTQVESREEGWSGWTLEPGGLDTESLTGVILEEAEAAIWLEKTRAELSPVENEKWNRDSWRVVRV